MNKLEYFTKNFIIGQKHQGMRIDQILPEYLNNYSRSQIKTDLIELKCNDKNIKLSYKVKSGDNINIVLKKPKKFELVGQNIPVEVIHNNRDFLIVNKPQGMVVHPAHGHYQDTLVNALIGIDTDLLKLNDDLRPGIVHRLDKDTSGLMIIAKNTPSLNYLSQVFKNRSVDKIYHAIVKGRMPLSKGKIFGAIGRDKHNRKKMSIVDQGGKQALTYYKVIQYYDSYTYLSVKPFTGRTHQIRVHLKSIGHPILGDSLYARKDQRFSKVNLCLCAVKLKFTGSDGIKYDFYKLENENFQSVLRQLAKSKDCSKTP